MVTARDDLQKDPVNPSLNLSFKLSEEARSEPRLKQVFCPGFRSDAFHNDDPSIPREFLRIRNLLLPSS